MSLIGGEMRAISERPILQQAAERVCLLVVGMHRSGTSAVTGMLSRLGADLPKTLMEANHSNCKGYGESLALMEFHDRLLASAGSKWDDFEQFNKEWSDSPIAESFAQELRELITTEFGRSPLIVVKDPRISRFLPIWLEQLDALNMEPRIVICLRNPLEVAASLNRRDGFPFTASLLLWLRHMLDAETATRDLVRAVVRYDDLLIDWRGVADRLGHDLSLHWPRRSGTVTHDIDNFVCRSLRHHEASQKQLLARKDVVEWTKIVYPILSDMGHKSIPASSTLKKIDNIKLRLDSACLAFGPLFAERNEVVDAATAKAKELESRTTEASSIITSLKRKIAALTHSLAEREATVTSLERKIAALTHSLAEREATVTSLERKIAALTHSLAEREATITNREQEMAALTRSFAKHNSRIEKLRRSLTARDVEIAALRDSTSWLVTEPLRRFSTASRALSYHIRTAANLGELWPKTGVEQRSPSRATRETPAPFIVGVGRSGTTLLRLMLDAHRDLAIPPETHFLPALLSLGKHTSPQAALDIVTRSDTWPNMGMTSDGLARVFGDVDSVSTAQAARAFFHLYSARFGKTRWGDKTPPYRNAMLTISASLPEAHFIHIIRDGRDVALSYRGLWFGPGDDLESQARFWVDEVERTRVQGKSVNYVEIRFEDLVTRPADTLTELCDWLDLPFDPAMLDYHIGASRRLSEFVQPFGPQGAQQIPLSRFVSIHERTLRAPDASRIARWKTEMAREDRRRYEQVAGSLLASLGYDMGF